MGRLIAFGCSLTYGHGLPDCFTPPTGYGPLPSKHAWPTLVAQNLGIEGINKGVPACSNKRISVGVLAYPFEKTDTVVILWSFYGRSMLYITSNHLVNILPKYNGTIGNKTEEFYRVHSDYDLFNETTLSISHVNLFLEKKQIKVYNFYFDQALHLLLTQYPNSPANSHNLIYIDREKIKVDIALDNMHPGVKSQELMAEIMLNIIKEKND